MINAKFHAFSIITPQISTMLIPITISSLSTAPLPPQLAALGNDELVLIELQGSLDVECTDSSERDGQMVGTFRLDEGSVSASSCRLSLRT